MIDISVDDLGFAGSANPFQTRRKDADARLSDDCEYRLVGRDLDGQTRTLQDQLERRVHFRGRFLRLGGEPLDVKRPRRPFLAELLHRVEQAFWPAAIDQSV